jgi:methylated-DNA-protein-cysteine methyltransferase-like protein
VGGEIVGSEKEPATLSESTAFGRFCWVLSQIPQGRVCSYGRLGQLADIGGGRQACRYLRLLPQGTGLPWYRIVNAQGKLADFANAGRQRQLLDSEGIEFTAKDRIPKHYYF